MKGKAGVKRFLYLVLILLLGSFFLSDCKGYNEWYFFECINNSETETVLVRYDADGRHEESIAPGETLYLRLQPDDFYGATNQSHIGSRTTFHPEHALYIIEYYDL